jgi:hypothetical protein
LDRITAWILDFEHDLVPKTGLSTFRDHALGTQGWKCSKLFSKEWRAEPVAQSVEHVTFNHGVLGSSPSGLTIKINNLVGETVLGTARRYDMGTMLHTRQTIHPCLPQRSKGAAGRELHEIKHDSFRNHGAVRHEGRAAVHAQQLQLR